MGDMMNSILVAIDAKYIHTNLAVRYLKANTTYETTISEYTIKDSIELITVSLLEQEADIIGFSCYIWNIDIIKEISRRIKAVTKTIIIYGGPEVSYDSEDLLENRFTDYIISGEGEIAFHQLLKAIHINEKDFNIPGVSYLSKNNEIVVNPPKNIKDLNSLISPYHFEFDFPHIANKIQYLETSRGCPFECSYCLASLENGVRYFDINRVKNEILYLQSHGAKTFKFLDRTFNIFPKYAISIFEFIFENYKEGMSFQFEITGDILKHEIIDYVNQNAPKNLIRFEIGIQSTNALTNLAVKRKQNNRLLFDNIRQLMKADKVDLHLDLIAGLPHETLSIFKKTFNDVFELNAKELQLGFLKLLKGTLLRNESALHHYDYQPLSPYEMISNQYLSEVDVMMIHEVEEVLETFWNKGYMNTSILLLSKHVNSVFDLFYQIKNHLNNKAFDMHRYQLYELFFEIDDFVYQTYREIYPQLSFLLKKDYLEHHPIKPKIYWDKTEINKNKVIRDIFLDKKDIPIDDMYKYSVIIKNNSTYFVMIYLPNNKISFFYPMKT